MAESKRSSRKARALELERKSLALRMSGASYRAIGDALGCSHQAASDAVERAMSRIEALNKREAARYRAMELQRLDEMQASVYRRARGGDVAAVDRVIKCIQERAKLLGLYAAEKKEVQFSTALEGVDFASLTDEQLAAIERGEMPEGLG